MSTAKHRRTAAQKKPRAIIWSSAIAAIFLIGGVVNACDPNTSPPTQPAGNVNIDTGTSTTAPFTTVEPATTIPAATIPAATIPAPPPVAEAPPPPAQTQADCGSNSYVNVDGQCVHDPETAASPPAGATAKCNDGTYSFSKHHSGTCSGHHGVAEWLS